MTVDSRVLRAVKSTISSYSGGGCKIDIHTACDSVDRRKNCRPNDNIRIVTGVITDHGNEDQLRELSVKDRLSGNIIYGYNWISTSDGSSNKPLDPSLTAAQYSAEVVLLPGIDIPVQRPIYKVESQELLPTRRHFVSCRGSAGSISSFSNRNGRKSQSRKHRERGTVDDLSMTTEPPKPVLKSILKKTRPILPLQSFMLQNHYLQNQQQQYLKQTKQYGTVHQQQHQHRNSLQRPTVSQMQSLRRDLRPAPLIETRSLDSSRPLPTPPPTKSVRWASHNEVLEIENIDELIQLGYYRDYDHGLEWGYCSESQDESSSDDDYEEDDEDNLSESENEYTSMFNSHKPQCQHRSFECESECNSITDSTFDDEDTESESQAAEDELIQRMSGEAFMLSLASSSSSSPTSLASVSGLSPSLQSSSIDVIDTTTGSPTHRQNSPQLHSKPSRTLRLTALPLRMQISTSDFSPGSSPKSSPTSPVSPLHLSAPSNTPQIRPSPSSSLLGAVPPRLDRGRILAEVAERKQKCEGIFAKRLMRSTGVVHHGVQYSKTKREKYLSGVSSTMSMSPSSASMSPPSSTASSCSSSPSSSPLLSLTKKHEMHAKNVF